MILDAFLLKNESKFPAPFERQDYPYFKSHSRSTERAANHEAKRQEQIAKGLLERQKLLNKKEAEESRKTLAELKAITAAVESTGQSKAEAQVR